jgi:hypothetical protein
MKKRPFFIPLLLFISSPVWTQQQPAPANSSDEQLSFVGMTVAAMLERMGPPRAVNTARGEEPWQDDVVFHYSIGDFYVYGDRVWQVKLASVYGISNGDRKSAALLVLGDAAEDKGEYILSQVTGKDWPLTLRINFNNSGLVSAIYIYRPDF